MKKIILMLFIPLFLFSSEQDKSEFELAKQYYKDKNYNESAKLFLNLTMQNDIRSYSYLGEFSGLGLGGIKKDCQRTAMFLFSGMKEGDCRSIKIISDFYKNGVCVKKSEIKYKKYLKEYNKCIKK